MSRFPFANLDLSLIPAPQAIHPVDYELIRAARLSDLTARFVAKGIPFNVAALESDPSVIHQEEDAYREMLDLQAINDAVQAVLLAFAVGSDLDNLGALLGVRRLTLTEATDSAPAVMESDADFRGRIRIALDATAVGLTGNGYRTIALQAAPAVKAVSFIKHGGGQIDVILLGRGEDGAVDEASVKAVRDRLNADDGGQLTDIVTVRSARPLPFDIVAEAIIPPGPTPSVIQNASISAIAVAMSALKVIGGRVPTDAIIAAGRVPPMNKFRLVSPEEDILPAPDEAPYLRTVSVALTVAA
jgi:phage-related baseplate assembly protein